MTVLVNNHFSLYLLTCITDTLFFNDCSNAYSLFDLLQYDPYSCLFHVPYVLNSQYKVLLLALLSLSS